MKIPRDPLAGIMLPVPVVTVISVILVILYGRKEINSFYNNPEHIGFCVPIGTFMLAVVLLVVILLTFIICSVIRSIKKKKCAGENRI